MPIDKLVGKLGKHGEAALSHPHYGLMKNMAFFSLANLAGNFFAFLFHFYIARQLTISDYGTLSALFAAFTLFSLPVGSFSTLVIKKVAQDNENAPSIAKSATRIAFVFSFVVGFLLMLFSGFFMGFFHLQGQWLVPLYAVMLMFGCAWAALNGVLQGMGRFFLSGSAFVAGSLAKLIAGFVLVGALGFGMLGAMGAFGMVSVACVFIGLWYLYPMLKSKDKEYDFSGIKKDFLKIIAIDAGMFLALNGDLIVLGNRFPDDSLGFYSTASTLAKIISYALLPLSVVAFPKLVEGMKVKKSSNVLAFTLALLAICGAAFLVFYYFAGSFVLSFLYSEKYLPGVQYLLALSAAVIFFCFNALLSRYFIAGKAGAYTFAVLAIPLAGLALLYAAPGISYAPYAMLGINLALFATGLFFLRLNGVGKIPQNSQKDL